MWLLFGALVVGFVLAIYFGGKGTMPKPRHDMEAERIFLPPEPMFKDPDDDVWTPL